MEAPLTMNELLNILLRRKDLAKNPHRLTTDEKLSCLADYFDIDADEIMLEGLAQRLHDDGILKAEDTAEMKWDGRYAHLIITSGGKVVRVDYDCVEEFYIDEDKTPRGLDSAASVIKDRLHSS